MKLFGRATLLLFAIFIWGIIGTQSTLAAGVVGTGSPSSCDSNDLQTALNGGGLVTFNCGNDPTIIIASTYSIVADTTIDGDNKITLDGENLRQLFLINNNVTLTLRNIVLLDGEFALGGCVGIDINGTLITEGVIFESCKETSQNLGGGAVYNLGVFTATDTLFLSNEALQEGGAIFNRGTFHATETTFEANKSGDDGGAIKNVNDGVIVIADSVFIGNIAQKGGGAIANVLSSPNTEGSIHIERALFIDNTSTMFGGALQNVIGEMTVVNSTFVRNTSDQGGAIFSDNLGITTIRFSTFSDNRADTGAGIYRPFTGDIKLGFSILSGGRNKANTANALECDGPSYTSLGYNLIEDLSCVSGSNATDIRDTAPQLGPLQNNGGFSNTQLPNDGSPALNKVPAAQCVERDQRLAERVGDCDIGAAERGGLFVSAYLPGIKNFKKK